MNTNPVEVLITVSFNEEQLESMRQISPRLRLTSHVTRRAEDIPPEVWARSEVIYTDRLVPDPALVPNLKWIQFHFAGIEFVLESALIHKPGLQITTLSGAATPQMAEFAMLALLSVGHKMADIMANQARAEWGRDRWEKFSPVELRGKTVGIIGYGSIGREIARLLQPWGCKILAVKRDVMHPHDTGYTPEGLGDPEGNFFQRLYPVQAMASMMKECDFVLVTLPLTPYTRNIIGARELGAMKPGAFLIVIGRGAVVDQAALLTALQEKKIAGAMLDVFAEEPLPPSSPFWKMPNVIVSPHISGISMDYAERAVDMFRQNLARYVNDMPLYNLFDPQRGY